jgi:hypothetical protein
MGHMTNTAATTIVLASDVDDPAGHGVSDFLADHNIDEDHPLFDEAADRLWAAYQRLTAEALEAAGYVVVCSRQPIGSADLEAEIARLHTNDDDRFDNGLPCDTDGTWKAAVAEVEAWLAAL